MVIRAQSLSHPEPLNGIALCAGIGGLEAGLHIAEPEYKTVCYVEREVFPASTLVARMEDEALDHAPVWDDVKTFNGRPWRGKVHILTGGYPCQPFSFAGRRQGATDPRHLWPDIQSIVREVEPEWCFFENVEGHLNLGASDVFNGLRGMGYSIKAGMFSARETGASQWRKRLFIVAHSDKIPLLQQSGNGTQSGRFEVSRRSKPNWIANLARLSRTSVDPDLALVEDSRSGSKSGIQFHTFPPAPSDFKTWSSVLERRPDLQPEFFGLDDGVAHRVDRSEAAGNGVVSLAAAYAWRTLKAAHIASVNSC